MLPVSLPAVGFSPVWLITCPSNHTKGRDGLFFGSFGRFSLLIVWAACRLAVKVWPWVVGAYLWPLVCIGLAALPDTAPVAVGLWCMAFVADLLRPCAREGVAGLHGSPCEGVVVALHRGRCCFQILRPWRWFCVRWVGPGPIYCARVGGCSVRAKEKGLRQLVTRPGNCFKFNLYSRTNELAKIQFRDFPKQRRRCKIMPLCRN